MAFSFSQPQQSLFQTPASQSSQPFQFQQSTPNPFQQQPQPQPQPQQQPQQQFQFQQQQPQAQPQFQLQQPQQQRQTQQQQQILFTVEKAPATYSTKWIDLHPDSQKLLLQIEERILEYRDESQRLDQCSRLYDSSMSNDDFELDANYIIQELGRISTAMERENILIQEQVATVNNMMRETEIAVRSFMILRQRFLHPKIGSTSSNVGATSQASGTATAPITSQTTSITPVFDFYNGVPRRPSPFMQHTVARFEKYLAECAQWIEELEQLLHLDTEGTASSSGTTSLQSVPNVMSNVHDYFVHVTAKAESVHQRIESMKTAYLADLRRRGDWNDPFLEADRRETAKQEAAARRVHPTLHLSAIPSQPSTAVSGLVAGSQMPGSASSVPQLSLGTPGAASGSTVSTVGTPSLSLFSASMPSSSLFSTPSTPTSTLFVSTGFLSQSTPFGSAQPSRFGSTTPPSGSFGFGSSPAFSTPPFASGAATGSGASFGGASKSTKPKSRTSRR